jgi:pyrroloquinoline quinone biosynthesis protein D
MAGWRLRPGVRLRHDPVRDRHVLLHADGVLLLNETGAAVLARCDGATDLTAVMIALTREYPEASHRDVETFMARLAARRLVEVADGG